MPASTFARLTKKLVDRGRFTVTELCDADLADCSERHFYNWLNGEDSTGREVHLPDYKVELLANYFCRHRETQPSSAFYCPDFVLVKRVAGRANGSTKDDLVTAIKAITGADDAFDSRDRDGMWRMLEQLREALANFESEYELLPE